MPEPPEIPPARPKQSRHGRKVKREPGPYVDPPPPPDLSHSFRGQSAPKPGEAIPDAPPSIRPALDMSIGKTRDNITMIRRAMEGNWLEGISQEEMNEFARAILVMGRKAIDRQKPMTAVAAAKALSVFKSLEIREAEVLDRIQRLDKGKPTSITSKPDDELIARLEKIVRAEIDRGEEAHRKVVANMAQQNPPIDGEAIPADSPIARIMADAATDAVNHETREATDGDDFA